MTVVTKTNLPNGGNQIIPVNTTKFTINVCFDYDGENIPSDVGKYLRRENTNIAHVWGNCGNFRKSN